MNWCDWCGEFLFIYVLRHETNSKPVEQKISPKYCPLCGRLLNKKGVEENAE